MNSSSSAARAVISGSATSWRRINEVVDLVGIFEPGVQVCSWPRSMDPAIATYLDGVGHTGTLQRLETLAPGDRAKLDMLPSGEAGENREGHQRLVDDLALLTEILCDLIDCPAVGLRVTRVDRAMCPKWHVDRVPMRMLCTYDGPGTEWLEDQGVAHVELSAPAVADGARQQAIAGEVVLLKGTLWQNNNSKGAIHRSPTIAPGCGPRTLVSLDPLWFD